MNKKLLFSSFIFLLLLFLSVSLFINHGTVKSVSDEKKNTDDHSSAVLPPPPQQELGDTNIKAESSIKEFIVTRAMVENFVAARGRSAASLLTAGLTLGFSDFLQEAALKYPDNPHVSMALLSELLHPGLGKAQWAENLVLHDPENRVGYIMMASFDILSEKNDDALKILAQSLDATGYNTYFNEELISLKDFVTSAGGSDNDAYRIFYQSKKSADAPNKSLARVIVESTRSIVKNAKLGEDVNDSITALLLLGDDLRVSPAITTIDEKLKGAQLNKFLCSNLVEAGLQSDDFITKTLDRSINESAELLSLKVYRDTLLRKDNPEEMDRFHQLVRQFGEVEALRGLQTMPFKIIK